MLTLTDIKAHKPCARGWWHLLHGLGKRRADRQPLSLVQVLDINGLEDAIWCLCALPTSEEPRIRAFTAAVARTALPQLPDHVSRAAERIIEWFERGAPDDERQALRNGDETLVQYSIGGNNTAKIAITFLTATKPTCDIAQYVAYHALSANTQGLELIFKEHFQ